MEGYIAQILFFGGNFAPRSFMFCHGQILSIAQNTALFSLIGTTFGGNGQTTFALPDARGRAIIGTGHGPGLTNRVPGEMAGSESNTLISTQMPAHVHSLQGTASVTLQAVTDNTDFDTAPAPSAGARLGVGVNPSGGSATAIYVPAGSGSATTGLSGVNLSGTTGITGNNSPVNNMQPYLVINPIICVEGIFPSRN